MFRSILVTAFVLAFVVLTSSLLPAEETVPSGTLDLHTMKQGGGEVEHSDRR